jgi:signal transduction histidine kinase
MLNAEQALPSGGAITLQAVVELNQVCLSLIDTGPGMSAEVLAKVFEPFFSTKTAGSGLGLPTTRKIVEAHGGCIEAQSDVGKGTKFTIRLPVHPACV